MQAGVDAALAALLFESEAVGVGYLDAELRYRRINERLAAMNGLPVAEHVGRHIAEVLPPEAVGPMEVMLAGVLRGEAVTDLEVAVESEGTRRVFLASYHPVRDETGQAAGLIAIVAERSAMEAALRASEGRLRQLSESGLVGLFLWTVAGGIYEANEAFLAMLGYTQADLRAGRIDWRRMTPPEYEATDAAAVELLMTHGRHGQYEKEYIGKDGRRVPVVVTSALIDGSREHGICVCLDVTARRSAEIERELLLEAERARAAERERMLAAERTAREEAEAARREAEAANRAKSEFLAVMSHELRTPLNAIGGYAELLELGVRGPVSALQREDLARIQKSQRHLLSLINEVLNYARLESGAVQFDLAPVVVADAIAAAEMLVMPQLRAKSLQFAVRACAPDIAVMADAEKLQQILLNLLSNAVKFTNARADLPGEITVSCRVEPARGGWPARVLVEVQDTGIGIPEEKLGAVFEPFVQVDGSLTRVHGGTGLGLAISRDLARGMGGDLVARSTVGQGSTFCLTLPAVVDTPV